MKTKLLLSLAILGLASCGKQASEDAEGTAQVKPYTLDVCLVSGEKLGSMGEPISLVHDGQEIKFCCDSCEPKFTKNPVKFLSKLESP